MLTSGFLRSSCCILEQRTLFVFLTEMSLSVATFHIHKSPGVLKLHYITPARSELHNDIDG